MGWDFDRFGANLIYMTPASADGICKMIGTVGFLCTTCLLALGVSSRNNFRRVQNLFIFSLTHLPRVMICVWSVFAVFIFFTTHHHGNIPLHFIFICCVAHASLGCFLSTTTTCPWSSIIPSRIPVVEHARKTCATLTAQLVSPNMEILQSAQATQSRRNKPCGFVL